MSTRFGVSASGNTGGAGRTMKRRAGLRWMSDQQTEAYLMAREALRRVQRSTPLLLPMQPDGQRGYANPARMTP